MVMRIERPIEMCLKYGINLKETFDIHTNLMGEYHYHLFTFYFILDLAISLGWGINENKDMGKQFTGYTSKESKH